VNDAIAGDGIHVAGLARSFGDVHAVRDVTFDAEPGRITALVGPNGSGKTTLLLMLATLLRPDRGTISIAGHDPVADPRAVRRRIGWMPDTLGSWAALSVRTTLQITARLYGIDRIEADARARRLIELVDLTPLADRPTRVLSRGQKQRLSLARALVHEPSVLLLDEPASGLDPASRAHLRQLLRRLADDGATILISSHVLAELEEMADDAVYLDAGVTASAERVRAARARTRTWRIRSLAPDHLAAALASAGVPTDAITSAPNATDVAVAGGDPEAAELLARIVGDGHPVLSFAPAVGDLEHTLLDLNDGTRP
jgi:ABC-type multidrug transport system ATPase subunit